jgi:hypothetical protein
MVVVVQVLKKFAAFMKPEGSLLCSQQPIPGPYLDLQPHINQFPPTSHHHSI